MTFDSGLFIYISPRVYLMLSGESFLERYLGLVTSIMMSID
jgi:hypothetical protein